MPTTRIYLSREATPTLEEYSSLSYDEQQRKRECTANTNTHTHTYTLTHIRSAHARIKVLQGNKHKIAYTTCCNSMKQLNFGTRCVLRVSLSWASNCKNLFRNSTIKNVDWPGCPLGKRSYHFAFISVFVNILLVFCLMLLAFFLFFSLLCLQCRVRRSIKPGQARRPVGAVSTEGQSGQNYV